MRLQSIANASILWGALLYLTLFLTLFLTLCLTFGALGCGKYGPPVRTHNQQAPAASQAVDPDPADDESESQPQQP